jgi:hypothetical protein
LLQNKIVQVNQSKFKKIKVNQSFLTNYQLMQLISSETIFGIKNIYKLYNKYKNILTHLNNLNHKHVNFSKYSFQLYKIKATHKNNMNYMNKKYFK